MADVNESNVYVVTQGRKLYGMPTDFGFCVKVTTLSWSDLVWPGQREDGSCLGPKILPGASEFHCGYPDSCPCTLHDSVGPALPHGDQAQTSGPKCRHETSPFPLLQPNKLRNGHKGLHIFCSEDEQSRTCWLAAFRLFKVRSWEWHGADPA